MGAVIGDQFLDRHLGFSERGVRQILVADGPLKNVVVMLARPVRACGLAGEVLTQHRRVLVHRLERIDQGRQRFVFDHHLVDAVVGGIAIGRNDEGDLLVLEQHLAVGQNHLHVARECRHPGEVDGL